MPVYIPVVTKKSGGKRPGAGRKPGSTASPPDDFFKLNDRQKQYAIDKSLIKKSLKKLGPQNKWHMIIAYLISRKKFVKHGQA